MTIKQYGGVFGRNPTFNDVTIEGQLTFDGDVDINSDLKVSGDIETTGNVIIATSGKGIDFSATSGTGTSELFDDYEEGLHTASITASTSGTITLKSGNDQLFYTKIGRLVHVSGTLQVNSVSSPVGRFIISLPFASSSQTETESEASANIFVNGSVSKNVGDFVANISAGNALLNCYISDVTSVSSANANAQELQANTSIVLSVVYTSA